MSTQTHAAAVITELDPSGVPCQEKGEVLALEHIPLAATVPAGLEDLITTSVEAVQADPPGEWFAWGCIDGRPVLFTVDPTTAAELRAALDAGERPTALVEPARIVARRLD